MNKNNNISESDSDSNTNTNSDSETEYDYDFINFEQKNMFAIKPDGYTYVHELFKYLNTDEKDIYNTNVTLVLFQINNIGASYFIRFLLEKNTTDNKMYFPKISTKHNVKQTIRAIFSLKDVFLAFKGYIKDDGIIHVFIQIDTAFPFLNMEFCLVDEIINQKMYLEYPIDDSVYSFLISNPDFFLLKNPVIKQNYEIPAVVYHGDTYENARIYGTFGFPRQGEYSLFGPNFYFTTLKKATQTAMTLPNNKPTIIRVAILLGNHHVINTTQFKYSNLENYDSIYVGEIRLNDNITNDAAYWVVKSRTHMETLSVHVL
jgi:hypothetical protein